MCKLIGSCISERDFPSMRERADIEFKSFNCSCGNQMKIIIESGRPKDMKVEIDRLNQIIENQRDQLRHITKQLNLLHSAVYCSSCGLVLSS